MGVGVSGNWTRDEILLSIPIVGLRFKALVSDTSDNP
jgi:hypothetical protein